MIESLCAIGFSGHRNVAKPELIQQRVAELLDHIAQNTPSRLIGVCSVAIGADVIFIEACLKRKLPWIAVLPMPGTIFFNEKDFRDEKTRLHAMNLLETAACVEITNPTADERLKYNPEYRSIAFSDS